MDIDSLKRQLVSPSSPLSVIVWRLTGFCFLTSKEKKTNCVCYTFLLKVLSWYSHGISDFNPMEVFCWGFFHNADNFNFSYCCKQKLLSITEGFRCYWTIQTTRCHTEGKARENSRLHLRSPCWSQFFWETPVYVQ